MDLSNIFFLCIHYGTKFRFCLDSVALHPGRQRSSFQLPFSILTITRER